MGLWSDPSLLKAQRKVTGHHMNRFVEPQQQQRANGSHVSKMHFSAGPHNKTARVCSFQEAAPTPLPPRKYYYSVFFHAEEVPLPESSGPADLNKSATWPRVVTQDAALANVCPLPHEVPLPPSPPPEFLSLDDEVAFFMSKPGSLMPCDVPLPPSPSPADIVLTPEKKYPDLSYIGFPSLDDDDEPKCPGLLPHEVPLPPSPPPTDAVLHMALTPEKKYPGLKNLGFPSLDDEVACFMSKPPSLLPHEIPLPPSPPPADAVLHIALTPEKKYPDLSYIKFPSLDDDDEPQRPSLLPHEVPLPPSPPPTDAVLHMALTPEKKYPGLKNLGFPSLDDEVACLMTTPPNLLPHEIPLPPSPPPADATFHVAHFHEKKYPDLSYIRFPSLDDDNEPKCPSLLPHEVPLPPSPPPTDAVLHMALTPEKKYPGLKNLGFPSLDDEVACLMTTPPNLLPHEIPLPPSPPPADAVLHMALIPEKKYPGLKNLGFPSLDDEVACFMSKPPSLLPHEIPLPPSPPPADAVLHIALTPEKKYPDLSYIRFPSLDDDDEPQRPSLLPHEIPLPPSPPPADAAPHLYTPEKKPLGLTRFPFLDVDTEMVPKPLSKMACVVPLPPSPPLHMVHTPEKKYPDFRNIGFLSLDDEVACLMSKPLDIIACDIPLPPSPSPADSKPLPPSPPLVETPHLAKKYLDLSFVTFPCLDDD